MEQVYQYHGEEIENDFSKPYILIEETAGGSWERKAPYNSKKQKTDC
jgi:hypothetical protein